jgi:hypothetical protein
MPSAGDHYEEVLLQSAIAKTVGAGRNKGMSQPVLERGV